MGKCLFMRKGETHTAPKVGLPSGYTELEYIQSTGTQWIDTLVAHSDSNSIVLQADVSYDTVDVSYQIMGYTGNGGCGIGLNKSDWWEANSIPSVTVGTRYTIEWGVNGASYYRSVNGTSISGSRTQYSFTSNLFLFAALESYNSSAMTYHCSCKLYSAEIYYNGTLIRDFIPCINPSGEIGLYDTVNKKFYGNKGTGGFKCNLDFKNCTWSEIIEACRTNTIPVIWNVGDQKTMTINGTNYPIDIIGKNHDEYADGSGKAPLTFQMHDLYDDSFAMNTMNTNQNGWNNSDLRKTQLPNIIANMPAEVRYGIKEVNKRASRGTTLVKVDTSVDKLFLLSEEEVFGTLNFCAIGEGSQYAYYAAGNSKLKVHHTSGSKDYWWLRSPYINSMSQFCDVGADGTLGIANATGTNGIAFAFCF